MRRRTQTIPANDLNKVDHKPVQPWHTESFHRARLMGILPFAIFLCINAALNHKMSGIAYCAFFYPLSDLVAIRKWKTGKVSVASWLPFGANGSKDQYRHFWFSVGGLCIPFFLALILLSKMIVDPPSNIYSRVLAFVWVNLFGWFLIPWLREVLPMIKQYYFPSDFKTTVVSSLGITPPPREHKQLRNRNRYGYE